MRNFGDFKLRIYALRITYLRITPYYVIEWIEIFLAMVALALDSFSLLWCAAVPAYRCILASSIARTV